jgi:2-haloacid dehalogenase
LWRVAGRREARIEFSRQLIARMKISSREEKAMNRRSFLAGALAAGGITPALSVRGVLEARQRPAAPSTNSALARSLQMLVFDTFGTVVDWRSSVSSDVEKLAREKGWTLDAVAFAEAWRAGYGPSMNRVRTGELPWTKLDGLHRMILDGLLVRFKIEGLSEEEKQHLNRVWHRLRPWPDAPGGLTRLKKRYVLSPLSNGNLALLTNMAKFGGLPWDCILGSDIVRHYKPDKEMYLMPGAFFDLPQSAVMMVAAHAGDLDSAKKNGLRTAYIPRSLEYGPTRPREPMPEVGRFDIIATDFNDLAVQLDL